MAWCPRKLLGLVFVASLAGSGQAADLAAMQPSEIEALQRRLADAKCYGGPINGTPSEALTKAVAVCPSQDPQLRIETGMHVAPVKTIDDDRDCRIAVTGSSDKTVRLWSLPEGRPLRTLRLPIVQGEGGKVYATALSPDGRFVAAGGYDARGDISGSMSAYIFDAATGALVKRVGAFDELVIHLVFSPDGRWLAATLAGTAGVRIIDTATWTEVSADRAYQNSTYGAAFGPEGRLYTVAFDGKLRSYGPGPHFGKKQEIATRSSRHPFSVAVDPSGQLIAVGFEDVLKVDVYDAKSLAFRYAAGTKGSAGDNLGNVAWRADGARLLAGGSYRDNRSVFLLTFGQDGRRVGEALPLAENALQAIQPCGTGFAVAAADPAIGLLDPDGRTRLWRTGTVPDMRSKLDDALMVSGNVQQIRFGLSYGSATPVLFDLAAGSLVDAPAVPGDLTVAATKGLPVDHWMDATEPSFAGKALAQVPNEVSRSLAIRADHAGFVEGSSFYLRSFDAAGQERWKIQSPQVTWGVNLSADGQIIVAAYGDGTLRWHRWLDGRELLTLFVNRETKAWVAWTPSGYYEASPGAEDMIGWHLNRGWDQAADFFPASRFRDRFDRPDIVRLALETQDEGKAIEQANAAGKRRNDAKAIIERLPPVLTILSPADGAVIDTGPVEIRYSIRSPSGSPVDRLDTFVDGSKIEARGLVRVDGEPAPDRTAVKGETTGAVTLPMPAHDAIISLVAYSAGLAGDPVRIELKGAAPANPPAADAGDALKPKLYAVLIGVTHYANPKFDLGYPAKDASDLAETLKRQKGRLYRQVEVKVLTDKDATATAVKDGSLWLQEQTTSRDLAIVFAAGHGMTDAKGKFWFLTTDANPNRLLSTAVSKDDIADVLFDLPGKKLLFIDACHSGAALTEGTRGLERTDLSAAVNDFAQAEGGGVAHAASTGREFSFEREEWGHGAFTKALIEGLEGKADLLHKGTVTTATLAAFIEDRVKELTAGLQHPVMTRPKAVPDFPIALAR